MKRHRKLYPTKGSDCSDYCSGDPFADFYDPFRSPPPPPFQTALFAGDDQSDGVSASVIVLFVLLSTLLLFLLYYIIVAKSCLGLCTRTRSSDGEGEIDAEEDGLSAAEHQHDHPIWMIATAGLQQSVINSIAVAKYKRSEGLVDGTDCSVCLSEFRDGETVRMLPKCSHAFHVACIDAWLRSHTNCPLCRANIVAQSPPQEDSHHAAADTGSGEIDAAAEDSEVVRVPALGRSVSMDHEVVKGRLVGGQKREERFWRMVRVSPVGMKKRSLSCGGMRFLSSSSMNRASSDGDSWLRLADSILLPL